MLDQKKLMDIGARVMQDTTPLPVEIDIMSAMVLISGLQLTVKHPGISGAMRRELTRIARLFQARIVERHPEADELIEMGWNAAFDVDGDGKFVNPPQCQHTGAKSAFVTMDGHIDLACMECNQYIAHWDGTEPVPEWVPEPLRGIEFVDDEDDWEF